MIPQKRKYIFIIVHFGSSVGTDALIKALLSNESHPDKVIVIDHATDKYVASLDSPELVTYRPSSNDGYASGINVGLGSLLVNDTDRDDIVTCMNNDVSIKPDFIASVKEWWSNNPERSLMGLKKGAVNLLSGRAVIETPSSLFTLPYLHGSFISAPYEVFASLQGWPDKYFLYWEDVLLSLKAIRKNIPLKVSSSIAIDHDDEIREKYTDDQTYYLVRNGALFLEKENSFFWRQYWFVVNRFRLFWHRYINNNSDKVVVKALADARKGITGKRTYE